MRFWTCCMSWVWFWQYERCAIVSAFGPHQHVSLLAWANGGTANRHAFCDRLGPRLVLLRSGATFVGAKTLAWPRWLAWGARLRHLAPNGRPAAVVAVRRPDLGLECDQSPLGPSRNRPQLNRRLVAVRRQIMAGLGPTLRKSANIGSSSVDHGCRRMRARIGPSGQILARRRSIYPGSGAARLRPWVPMGGCSGG